MENAGIDPATSHMLSERSTIWANSPIGTQLGDKKFIVNKLCVLNYIIISDLIYCALIN